MKTTQFQKYVQTLITGQDKPSVLLIAPTGLGKTFAVTGDLQNTFTKIIFAVPLRALGNDVHRSISNYKRFGKAIKAAVHHGAVQESELFGEEVVVTTYDQVVCGVPGLPLSLPLKAGHAVAGALLMCRLIFDEAHLAWGISDNALSILLAIVQFRDKLGLQTILQTATLPDAIADLLAGELKIKKVIVGAGGDVPEDDGLKLREENRRVIAKSLELKPRGAEKLSYALLDSLLTQSIEQVIYFANTVDRIQQTYDRLLLSGIEPARVLVLHNRMPHEWRTEVEKRVRQHFGEDANPSNLILLTNQVAEAGLNISAATVISDPAPVDTLVQRAGRCARWFRTSRVDGTFYVLNISGLKEKKAQCSEEAKEYASPYKSDLVYFAMKSYPDEALLSWQTERDWVNKAWGGGPEKARAAVEKSLRDTAFALNLFDRAMQDRQPGQIANVFREILSVEVGIEHGNKVSPNGSGIVDFSPDSDTRDLQQMLDDGKRPDTSSISLSKAYNLLKVAAGNAAIIRWEDDKVNIRTADGIQVGDILILPSSMAYLHRDKGLCFGAGEKVPGAILQSEWKLSKAKTNLTKSAGHRQTLIEHTSNVLEGTFKKLAQTPAYTKTLMSLLAVLEGTENAERLVRVVVQIACVSVAFHDLGKADTRWQRRVRELDPGCLPGLVGRSISTGQRIGVPHTPPGYSATVTACRLLMGERGKNAESLIRAIALAACRHHSSLFNPAAIQNYTFMPHQETTGFVETMLRVVGAPQEVVARANEIIAASLALPGADEVPLMLPNHELFPIYSLVGRAILLADREDAAGKELEYFG